MSRMYSALWQADSDKITHCRIYRAYSQWKANVIFLSRNGPLASGTDAKIKTAQHDEELMVAAYTKISKYSQRAERSLMLLHILAGHLREVTENVTTTQYRKRVKRGGREGAPERCWIVECRKEFEWTRLLALLSNWEQRWKLEGQTITGWVTGQPWCVPPICSTNPIPLKVTVFLKWHRAWFIILLHEYIAGASLNGDEIRTEGVFTSRGDAAFDRSGYKYYLETFAFFNNLNSIIAHFHE